MVLFHFSGPLLGLDLSYIRLPVKLLKFPLTLLKCLIRLQKCLIGTKVRCQVTKERHQTAAIYPSTQASSGSIMAASDGQHIPIYRTTIRYWTVHGHVDKTGFCSAIAKHAKEFIKFPETEQDYQLRKIDKNRPGSYCFFTITFRELMV